MQAAKSDNLVFSNTLPASAVNLGLGANAFPGEASQKDDLISVVGKNITLFLQEMFGKHRRCFATICDECCSKAHKTVPNEAVHMLLDQGGTNMHHAMCRSLRYGTKDGQGTT